MKRVLFDGDLFLEFNLFPCRYPYLDSLFNSQQIEIYLTEQCLDKIRFYANKENPSYTEQLISILENKEEIHILTIGNKFIHEAEKLPLLDFESAIEIICAMDKNLDAIITRNPQNFNGTDFPIWSVENLPSRLHLGKCLSLSDVDSLEIYQTYTAIPSFHPLETVGIMKYHIRHSITTVMEVFRLLEKEGYQGISRHELQKKFNYQKGYDYSKKTINSIILDLQNFYMITIQSDRVTIKQDLLALDNIAIANHIAKFLNQHIVVQTIYQKIKHNKSFTRAYLQKLIMELELNDKENNQQFNEYDGKFLSLPLGFNVYVDNNSIANKSASDYISRMLGWLLFVGLLEKNKETIIIPIKKGKQKGQLIEDDSIEHIDSIHKQLDLF